MASPVMRAKVQASQLTDTARNDKGFLPSGKIIENCPRYLMTNSASPASGTLHLSGGFVIPAGRTITSITFYSGGTALNTGSNQWFGLFDTSGNVLRLTSDDTSTAWGTNTPKALTLSSTYTPSSDIEVYVGVCIVATTRPSLICSAAGSNTALVNTAPSICGDSTTGLTTPASAGSSVTLPTGTLAYYATLA